MKSNKNSNRSFGILFFIVFLIIGTWPILSNENIRWWSIIVSVIFLLLGSINSGVLTPLKKLWIKFGEYLGKIIAPIVMAAVYFVVVTPIGIILNLFKKDLLKLNFNSSSTYWIKRDKNLGPMKRQF